MKSKSGGLRAALLLEILDEAFDHKAWHGPNLRGAIRRVDAVLAAWRPAAGRHSIAEIAVHAAYWKYASRRRLRGDKRGSFALKGSNWFALPQPLTEAAWREFVGLLDVEHESLRCAVAELSDADLSRVPPGSRLSNLHIVRGIAMHDVYHAGQIQTIKALWKGRRAP